MARWRLLRTGTEDWGLVKLERREGEGGVGLGGGYLDIRPCTPGTRRTALNDEAVDTCNDDDVDKKIVGNSHCDIIYTDIAQPELLRSHLTHLSHFIYRSLSSCGGGGGTRVSTLQVKGELRPLGSGQTPADHGSVVAVACSLWDRIFLLSTTQQFSTSISRLQLQLWSNTCLKQMNIYILSGFGGCAPSNSHRRSENCLLA